MFRLSLLPLILFTFQAQAATTNTFVYCALPDGSHWDWAYDTNSQDVEVQGSWGVKRVARGGYFDKFRIPESTYQLIQQFCPSGYVPHPEKPHSIWWEVFEVVRVDGSTYIADGHKSIHGMNRHHNHYLRSL